MKTPTYVLTPLFAAAIVACQGTPDDDSPPDDYDVMYTGTIEGDVSEARTASGSVDLDQATTVEAWSVADDGSMALIGTADVQADGQFAIEAPSVQTTRGFTVVQAVDARGELVVSNVVEETGRAADATREVRLDPEATLEVLVWLDRTRSEGNPYAGNLTDIRFFIDGGVALQAYDRVAADADAALIASLSTAADAAMEARTHSLRLAGWTGDASSYYLLGVTASQQLSDDLRTQGHSLDTWATAYASVDTALQTQGMTAQQVADAHSSAALAYQLAISTDDTLDAMLADEALRGSMRTEAWATSSALSLTADTMQRGGTVATAAADVWADVYYASSREQAVGAFVTLSDTLEAEMIALAEVQTLLTTDVVQAWVDGEVDTLPTGDLGVEIDALLSAFSTGVDTTSDAQMVAEFWADLRADIRAAVEASALFDGDDTSVVTELALHASFHTR